MEMAFFLLVIAAISQCTYGFNIIADLSREQYPQVIGHAGSSGYVPESSLIGYDLAANMFADYSEPDLVLSKDGQFFGITHVNIYRLIIKHKLVLKAAIFCFH